MNDIVNKMVNAFTSTRKFCEYFLAPYRNVIVNRGLTIPAMYVCAGLDINKGEPTYLLKRDDQVFYIYDRVFKVRFISM